MALGIGQKIISALRTFSQKLYDNEQNIFVEELCTMDIRTTPYTPSFLPKDELQMIASKTDYVDACRRENATIRESYGAVLITYIRRPQKLTLPARKMSNDELVAYYRGNFQNTPIGCVVALKIDGEIHLGWSLCHIGRDRFNKVVCLNKALNKALSYGGDSHLDVPTTVVPYINRMKERASKYFFKIDDNDL